MPEAAAMEDAREQLDREKRVVVGGEREVESARRHELCARAERLEEGDGALDVGVAPCLGRRAHVLGRDTAARALVSRCHRRQPEALEPLLDHGCAVLGERISSGPCGQPVERGNLPRVLGLPSPTRATREHVIALVIIVRRRSRRRIYRFRRPLAGHRLVTIGDAQDFAPVPAAEGRSHGRGPLSIGLLLLRRLLLRLLRSCHIALALPCPFRLLRRLLLELPAQAVRTLGGPLPPRAGGRTTASSRARSSPRAGRPVRLRRARAQAARREAHSSPTRVSHRSLARPSTARWGHPRARARTA
mmetsp:Transcript_37087/g.87025  ORF Transcript_37087/g.87025 Transcript_37087/m.87025 type:complete len:303 (+) Transcript_37087:424-1332(+)